MACSKAIRPRTSPVTVPNLSVYQTALQRPGASVSNGSKAVAAEMGGKLTLADRQVFPAGIDLVDVEIDGRMLRTSLHFDVCKVREHCSGHGST